MANTDNTRNPYTPPEAAIADAPVAQEAPPRTVVQAVWMMRASYALGVIELITGIDFTRKPGGSAFLNLLGMVVALAILLAVLAAYLWVIESLRRRRNWARITLLIVLAFGIVATLTSNHKHAALPFVLDLLSTLLHVVALAFLFTPPASRWFQRVQR